MEIIVGIILFVFLIGLLMIVLELVLNIILIIAIIVFIIYIISFLTKPLRRIKLQKQELENLIKQREGMSKNKEKFLENLKQKGYSTLAKRKKIKMCIIDLQYTDKITGYEFEDYLKDQLSKLGISAQVTQKSNDYGIDLLVNGDVKYGIQLKNYITSTVGVRGVQEAYTGGGFYTCVPVVLSTGRFTKNAKTLAKQVGVELIEREDILEWHNSNYKRKYKHKKGFYEYIRGEIILDDTQYKVTENEVEHEIKEQKEKFLSQYETEKSRIEQKILDIESVIHKHSINRKNREQIYGVILAAIGFFIFLIYYYKNYM